MASVSSSPGAITGMPGGYGQIISAPIRPAAFLHGTDSVAPVGVAGQHHGFGAQLAEGQIVADLLRCSTGMLVSQCTHGFDESLGRGIGVGVQDDRGAASGSSSVSSARERFIPWGDMCVGNSGGARSRPATGRSAASEGAQRRMRRTRNRRLRTRHEPHSPRATPAARAVLMPSAASTEVSPMMSWSLRIA
jgi:hypothetical protein